MRLAMRPVKGQILVFEQVLLFMIGLLIFIICLASFSAYQTYFTQAGNEDQLSQVSDYVAYALLKASEGGNSTETYYSMALPKYIGGENYRLSLSPAGLNITMLPSMKSRFLSLPGMSRSISLLQSDALSSSGKLVLYKNGDNIRLV